MKVVKLLMLQIDDICMEDYGTQNGRWENDLIYYIFALRQR